MLILTVFFLLLLLIFLLAILDIDEEWTVGILLLAIIVWFFLLFMHIKYDYKQGQIDALTGKIKYELRTNADSTKTWEKK